LLIAQGWTRATARATTRCRQLPAETALTGQHFECSIQGDVGRTPRTPPGANITLPEGRNPDQPQDFYLDTTRLQADTGFRPEYDVARAVPDYVDWLRRHDH